MCGNKPESKQQGAPDQKDMRFHGDFSEEGKDTNARSG